MLADRLSIWFEIFLPQRDHILFVELVGSGLSPENARRKIFEGDIKAIKSSEIFLILLDGRTVDEGASFELGFAYAQNKICIGLQTDPRRLLQIGNNPMIEEPLEEILQTIDELESWAERLA